MFSSRLHNIFWICHSIPLLGGNGLFNGLVALRWGSAFPKPRDCIFCLGPDSPKRLSCKRATLAFAFTSPLVLVLWQPWQRACRLLSLFSPPKTSAIIWSNSGFTGPMNCRPQAAHRSHCCSMMRLLQGFVGGVSGALPIHSLTALVIGHRLASDCRINPVCQLQRPQCACSDKRKK